MPSLKLTAKAPENRPSQKENSSSNHQFSGAFAVSFREGDPYTHQPASCHVCSVAPSDKLLSLVIWATPKTPTWHPIKSPVDLTGILTMINAFISWSLYNWVGFHDLLYSANNEGFAICPPQSSLSNRCMIIMSCSSKTWCDITIINATNRCDFQRGAQVLVICESHTFI